MFSRMLGAPAPLALLVAGMFAASAGAQTPAVPPTTATTPAASEFSLADSIMSLVDIRSIEEISHDLEELASQKTQAEARILDSKSLQARADTAIKVKQTQIKSLEVQVDLAKKEKDPLKQSDLEAKKKYAGLEKNLLARRKTLRDREIKFWTATRDFIEMRRKSGELELGLANERLQRSAIVNQASSPAAFAEVQRLERDLQTLERQTLDAQIAAANKRQEVAKQEAEMGKARKEIFEAQVKVRAGG